MDFRNVKTSNCNEYQRFQYCRAIGTEETPGDIVYLSCN